MIQHLSVNGLRPPSGLATPAFPAGAPMVLAWVPAPQANDSNSFFVELTAYDFVDRVVWSSGLVAASQPHLHLSPDLCHSLTADTTYEWRVKYEGAEWGPSARFDTAPEEWGDAAWIGGGSMLRTDWALPLGRSVVRGQFGHAQRGSGCLNVNKV